MANDNHEFTDEDFSWAEENAEQYKSRTEKTRDVLVPEGQVPFRMRVMQPARLMSFLEKYGLKEVSERVSDEANLSDEGVDAERTLEFIRDVIFPNVVKPDQIYYKEDETEDEAQDTAGFNFVYVSNTDLEVLIAVMSDTPPEKAIELAEQGEGALNVTSDNSVPGFRDSQKGEYSGRFR